MNMTGKDAFLALGSCILAKNKHYRDNDIQLLCLSDKTHEMISPQEAAGLVIEELELGEKNKKVIEIIKTNFPNFPHKDISVFELIHLEMTNKEDYKILEEVFGNE